jgi:hypothetical protein
MHIKVNSWIRIRIEVKSWIRMRIEVNSWIRIRIRIKVNSCVRIRIRIYVMRIRSLGFRLESPVFWGFATSTGTVLTYC